jgi:hypothetical protein
VKEVAMKKNGLLTVLLLAFVVAAYAQDQEKVPLSATYKVFAELKSYQECNVGKYARNFMNSLEYPDCSEIVECGLAQIAMLKLAQPNCKNAMIKDKIDDLAMNGETPAIRYKAYITSMVFENPGMFVYEKYGSYECGDDLFRALSKRMEQTMLAVN